MSVNNIINQPTVSEIKRFLEQYCGNKSLREALKKGEDTEPFGVKLDPEKIRDLWDNEVYAKVVNGELPENPYTREYRENTKEKIQWREMVKAECEPENEQFKIWRNRQIKRCALNVGDMLNDRLIHTPIIFEIADGCSVGCSFCGLDAPKLKTLYPYDGNENTWKEVLYATKDILGKSARWGTAYFATEPLDNPDYEKFCMDYSDILGMFPQTTTAVAHLHVERLRKLIKLSYAKGCMVDRFSVLTLSSLKKIHEAFTPEELVHVELILQNEESTSSKSASGRFLKKVLKDATLSDKELSKFQPDIDDFDEEQKPLLSQTICCLSGFLVNMVNGTVKLISPCKADEKWPLGYIVYDEGTFQNAKEFKELLQAMIKNNMEHSFEELEKLSFRDILQYNETEEGFEVADKYRKIYMSNKNQTSFLKTLGKYIKEGNKTAAEIALLMFYKHGIEEEKTLKTIEQLWINGTLDETISSIKNQEQLLEVEL